VEESGSKLNFWNAILIGIVTVVAALVAWRASVAGDASGDADYDGLRSVVNMQESTTLGTVEAYAHAQAYANYRRYAESAATLEEQLEETPGNVELQKRLKETEVLVDSKLSMFPNKLIERSKEGGGSYNAGREVAQHVASEARTKDTTSEEHFQEAEVARTKTEKLLLGVVILTLSLGCLTLVEALEGAAQRASFGAGLLLALAGTVYSVAMEVTKHG